MLKYITSVIIFYIIIKASISIGKIFLDNNGRLEKIRAVNKNNKLTPSILITACVPFFRLIVVVLIYYICFCDEEQFKRIIKKD